MSDHVVDQIADYLADRLDDKAVRAVKKHVAGCEECAADFEFAREFQEQAVMQGAAHPYPDRIMTVAIDRKSATATERAHLANCRDCRAEITWIAQTSQVPPAARPLRRWIWGAGVVALAAVIALLVLLPGDRSGQDDALRPLARIEPLPVHISRGPVEPGSFEALRPRGLELYRDERDTAAGEQFALAAAVRRYAEIYLYRGSVELLLGRPQLAATFFGAVVGSTTDETLEEMATWQLANAELAADRQEGAEAALARVVAMEGAHTAAAAALLAELNP